LPDTVAKGYSQIPGPDFTETTSPVAQLASYCALLSLTMKLNLEAHHLTLKWHSLMGLWMKRYSEQTKHPTKGQVSLVRQITAQITKINLWEIR